MPTPITREALYDHITKAEPVVIVEALGPATTPTPTCPARSTSLQDRSTASPRRSSQSRMRPSSCTAAERATPLTSWPATSSSSATATSPCTPAARRTGSNTASPSNAPTGSTHRPRRRAQASNRTATASCAPSWAGPGRHDENAVADRPQNPDFVGRTDELALFERAFADARSRGPVDPARRWRRRHRQVDPDRRGCRTGRCAPLRRPLRPHRRRRHPVGAAR